MRITIDFTKSLEQNASEYFNQAKKSKKKIEGAKKALSHTKIKLDKLEQNIKKKELEEKQRQQKVIRKKAWYEKFRWFYTSENMLFIAGRDATTNEIIIKKHTDKEDLVFHSELPASPFGVLKTESKKPSEKCIEECAQFVACYSKAWKTGVTVADIFYVNPDQVSKEAPSGEFIGKGSFMIYGKKTILTTHLKLFIGKMEDGRVMSGPESAVKTHCKDYVEIIQGKDKTSAIAKKIKAKLNSDDLDDIVKVIPVGSKLGQ